MGCLPSQAAVIVVLTLFCVTITSAATLGQACNETEAFSCTGSNEICDSEFCKCNVTAGYTNVSGECKLDIPMVVISQNPIEQDATVTISCTVTTKLNSTVISSVEWFRNGSLLSTADSDKYSGGNMTTPSLSIHSLDSNDGGEYRCAATNQYGSANSTESVTLAAPSAVMINISKNLVDHGDSVTFYGSYSSVLTVTDIKWKKKDGSNFVDIDTANDAGSSPDVLNPKLIVNSVMFSDETSYRLDVKNRIGSTTSNQIELKITGGGLTISTGGDVLGKVGESVTINCIIKGPERNLVWWLRYINNNNTSIVIDNTTYSGGSVDNPALTIKSLSRTDRAQYQCNAGNPRGNFSSTNKTTVRVYGKFNEDCSTEEPCEEQQNLECSSSTCICSSKHYHKDNMCYAESGLSPNIISTSSTTSQLSVSWSQPSIHNDLISGYEVQWRVNGASNQTSGRLDKASRTYTVSSGLKSGQLYTVTVMAHVNLTNPSQTIVVNSQSVSERLETLPPSGITGNNLSHDNLILSWTAPSNTFVTMYEVTINGTKKQTKDNQTSIDFTVEWLVPGEHYNVMIVTVSGTTNIVKKSSPYSGRIRITPTEPGPPTDVTCPQQPLDVSLDISWTAPTNPNGDIVQYQINIIHPEHPNPIKTNSTNTNYNVIGLNPEQNYTFNVQTINDAAESIKVSKPSENRICGTKAGVSSSPTNLVVDEIESRGFQISFAVPINVSGNLAGYKIVIKDGSECAQQIIVRESNCGPCMNTPNCTLKYHDVSNISEPVSYNVTDLKPFTNYLVEVAAVNGKGEGHRVNKSAMTKEEIPLKPEEITAEIFNATSLTLSWNIPDPSPGNTIYTIYVYESTDDKGTSFTLNQTLKSYGFISKSVQVYDLEEYWPYYFEVDAATMKGNNKSDRSTTVRTSQAAPGMVVGLSVNMKGEDYRKAYVSWSLPPLREHNGVLKNYIFKSNFSGNSDEYYIPVNLSRQKEERIFDVIPETVYEIEVALENNKSEKGKPSKNFYTAKAGPPPKSDEAVIETIPGHHAPTTTTITVNFDTELFKNDSNGRVVFFGIAVCAQSKCDDSDRNKEEWKSLRNWHKAKGKGFLMYRATNDTYMDLFSKEGSRKKRSASNDPSEFIVGEDATCPSLGEDTYCNGPLDPGISYRVIIFACTNGGCTQSDSNGYYATNMKPEDKPFPLGIVVGVACAVVAVALVIGAVIIFRSRRSSLGRTKSYTKGLHDPPDTEDPVSKNIPRKRPIKLKELADKVAEKHKDSNLHFAREYDDLKALCAKHSTETSETDSNKLKNRYVNILPFDHSRVKLMLTEDDDPSTDFINANYLPGYKSPREYIATQGPIPGTIDDFWRMIWEQNVSIIVMLTLCKEEGRVKCEMYWPENTNEPKQYGDLVVETVSNSTVNFYDFRIFKIKLGDTTRSVKHFHFLQWKDFSANVQNDVMIDFIKNVRNHIRPPDMNGPVVVHCSAGVGRTGTYCALDHLFQFIDEHELDESIDIFDLVMNLREQRMCMVQTEQQYIFIHDCVKDYLEKKLKQEECLYENQAFVHDDVEEDESLYQNYNNQRTDL